MISEDYRDILKEQLQKKQNESKSQYSISKLGEAANVQKTYMSRALKTEAHLNSDQIFLACNYLQMTDIERQYTLTLAEFNRSSSLIRKKELARELKNLLSSVQKTKNQLKLPEDVDISKEYFSDPMHQIVHLGFTIDTFSQKPDELRKSLNLNKEYFENICSFLEKNKVIKFKDNCVVVIKDRLHLDKESSYFKPFTISNKLKTIESFARSIDKKRMDLSIVFSASHDTREKIQQELMCTLEKIKILVEKSSTQSVYQLNIDLFDWLN